MIIRQVTRGFARLDVFRLVEVETSGQLRLPKGTIDRIGMMLSGDLLVGAVEDAPTEDPIEFALAAPENCVRFRWLTTDIMNIAPFIDFGERRFRVGEPREVTPWHYPNGRLLSRLEFIEIFAELGRIADERDHNRWRADRAWGTFFPDGRCVRARTGIFIHPKPEEEPILLPN